MIKIDANQLVCINFYYRTQREGVFVRVRLPFFMIVSLQNFCNESLHLCLMCLNALQQFELSL